MKQLNMYFFGVEKVAFSDMAYFYGTLLSTTLITAWVVL